MAAVSCCGGKCLLHEADLTRAIKSDYENTKKCNVCQFTSIQTILPKFHSHSSYMGSKFVTYLSYKFEIYWGRYLLCQSVKHLTRKVTFKNKIDNTDKYL